MRCSETGVRADNLDADKGENIQVLAYENSCVLQDENTKVLRNKNTKVLFYENIWVLRNESRHLFLYENTRVLQDENIGVLQDENIWVLSYENTRFLQDENIGVLFHENTDVFYVGNTGALENHGRVRFLLRKARMFSFSRTRGRLSHTGTGTKVFSRTRTPKLSVSRTGMLSAVFPAVEAIPAIAENTVSSVLGTVIVSVSAITSISGACNGAKTTAVFSVLSGVCGTMRTLQVYENPFGTRTSLLLAISASSFCSLFA